MICPDCGLPEEKHTRYMGPYYRDTFGRTHQCNIGLVDFAIWKLRARVEELEGVLNGLMIEDDYTFTVVKNWGMEESGCSLCGGEKNFDSEKIAHAPNCPVLSARAVLKPE